MEKAFLSAWTKSRSLAQAAGIRLRPIAQEEMMKAAHRSLSGSRTSDGFAALAQMGHLEWSLEALVVDKRFTGLFSDEEANEALQRLMEANYFSISAL